MKLTEKSQVVFDYVKENGGRVSIDELCSALDRNARSIGDFGEIGFQAELSEAILQELSGKATRKA